MEDINIKIYLKHGNVKDIFYQGCIHNGKVETFVDIGAIYEPMLIDAINGDLSVEYLTKHELIKKQIHTNQETIMKRLQSFKKIIKIVGMKVKISVKK